MAVPQLTVSPLSQAASFVSEVVGVDVITADGGLTLLLASAVVLAACAVLALLPWTDEQIAATDAEARALARHTADRLAPAPVARHIREPRAAALR